MTNEVVFFKLSSGEEILAEKVGSSSFVNCLQVFVQPMQDGQIGIQFMPWPFAVEEDEPIVINPVNIIFSNTPKKDLVNKHREWFGKIQIVSNSLLHS